MSTLEMSPEKKKATPSRLKPTRGAERAGGGLRNRLAAMGYAEGTSALRPAPSPTPRTHTPLNSMAPGSAEANEPLPDLKGLERLGYLIYPVASLEVLNSAAKENPDPSLRATKTGPGGYDVVTSGTFYYGGNNPAGAVMRDGKLDTPGVDKAKNRGGLAVLEDGTIVIKRMQGNTSEAIQRTFGTERAKVEDFMGGGALLIEDGKKVTSEDLEKKQKFDQRGESRGRGLSAQQMRQTNHIVGGIRDGQCFMIVAKNKTGAQIQNDLFRFGFDSVIKFDGGSGFYARDQDGEKGEPGRNPTGFGVKTRR